MSAGPVDDRFLWKADKDPITIQAYEDVFLAFDRLSGDTHILNFLSAALLDTLFSQPWQFADLVKEVRQKLDVSEEDCPDTLIKTTLLELDDVGLAFPYISNAQEKAS